MIRIFLLYGICCTWALTAEETNISAEQQQKAEQLAQAYMQELTQKRAQLDEPAHKDIQALDLLVRKAEAYVLVEQPIDAGRMMSAAHDIIKKYQDDQRDQMRALLKTYSKRLSHVAQVVLKHTAQLDLDPEDTAPKPAQDDQTVEHADQQNDQGSATDDPATSTDQAPTQAE